MDYFRRRSVGFIIIASCVAIVLALVFSIVFATFTSFQNSTREAVGTQTRELSGQIVYNYERYIATVIETSNIIRTDISRYGGRLAFSAFLAEIVHLNSDIVKLSLYDYPTGVCIASSDRQEAESAADYRSSDWFSKAADDPTIHVFTGPYTVEEGDYRVNISKPIQIWDGRSMGVLKIEISFQNFIELAGRANLGEGGHITIIDSDYNVVYSSTGQKEAVEEAAVLREIVLGSKEARVGGHNMNVFVDTLSNTKWRICVFTNIDGLAAIERDFLIRVVLVSFMVLTVGIFLFWSASRMIITPMKQLEQAMRKVEKADWFRMEEVDLIASREVQALTLRFNKMMRKIAELMERLIAEQNAQRKSELKALQNQINPHFLYNTLDSTVWLIENNKNREAGEMVVSLARLFRLSISKDREVIPLRDELEHARSYLLIQSIRYADCFDYEFDIGEGVLDCLTMKLILQPIIENSIYHGLKNKIDRGKITISARREGEWLYLSVSDNGYGMRPQTIEGLYASFADGVVSDSVGLKNIYQRVMIYYGGNAEMRIESRLDEGTEITVKEPLTS
ncbi:MAG: sensor histidine kinase [Oscillospiraceae bacterium]|nr:sensor histidine kinase [Oscillospiraceae bacterium]